MIKKLLIVLLLSIAGCEKETIHDAIFEDDFHKMEKLIDNGADINASDENGYSPLQNAIRYAVDKKIILRLLESNVDINLLNRFGDTALISAIIIGDSALVKTLIEKGADVNLGGGPSLRSEPSSGPLYIAAIGEKIAIMELLLANGAIVNNKSIRNGTPLHAAMVSNNFDVVKFLISKGADVNAIMDDGYTPLHAAVLKDCNKEVLEILVQNGADIDAVDDLGNTALYYAKRDSQIELVDFLSNYSTDKQ